MADNCAELKELLLSLVFGECDTTAGAEALKEAWTRLASRDYQTAHIVRDRMFEAESAVEDAVSEYFWVSNIAEPLLHWRGEISAQLADKFPDLATQAASSPEDCYAIGLELIRRETELIRREIDTDTA